MWQKICTFVPSNGTKLLMLGHLSKLDGSRLIAALPKIYAMVNNFKVITLCGSTRFKEAFLRVQKQLTLEGNIVISVGMFGHSGDEEVWKPGIKDMLDRMHLSKIDMADEIFVINVDGYIGESTSREIAYALAHGKTVKYLEKPRDPMTEAPRNLMA